MSDYHLFGWRVRSALALSELLPWRGDDRPADLTIEIGPVPPLDDNLPCFSPAVQICPTGVRVSIPAVASFWVEAGRRVLVQPALPVDAPDIRIFLLGTVLAILCFQRGLLPLHASAIDIGGRAILLAGHSGAGKSTLAAAFVTRGYRLLSDDLCALDNVEGAAPQIRPAFPRLRLWADSACHLRIETQGLERSRAALEKYHVPVTPTLFEPAPLLPAHIFLLRKAPTGEQPGARQLRGLEALRRYDLVHRARLGLALGQQASIFAGMARLVETTPVVEFTRSENFVDLPALVDGILALVDAPPS